MNEQTTIAFNPINVSKTPLPTLVAAVIITTLVALAWYRFFPAVVPTIG